MSGIEIAVIAGIAGSTLLGVAGQVQQAQAASITAKTAKAQQAIADRQAEFMERQAGQEQAVAQRTAIDEQRQGRLISSRAQAIAAASGAGALDPTIVNILGDIDTEAEIRALTALYEGDERASGLRYDAALTRQAGLVTAQTGRAQAKMQRNQAILGAAGTLLEGGTSLATRYQRRGPTTTPLRYSAPAFGYR